MWPIARRDNAFQQLMQSRATPESGPNWNLGIPGFGPIPDITYDLDHIRHRACASACTYRLGLCSVLCALCSGLFFENC